MSYLLQAGSDPNAVDDEGNTSLDLAKSSEIGEIFRSLRPVGKQDTRFIVSHSRQLAKRLLELTLMVVHKYVALLNSTSVVSHYQYNTLCLVQMQAQSDSFVWASACTAVSFTPRRRRTSDCCYQFPFKLSVHGCAFNQTACLPAQLP